MTHHAESVLPRPIESCCWIDPIDGTCSHPRAMTPECWQEGADSSDCPPLRSVAVALGSAPPMTDALRLDLGTGDADALSLFDTDQTPTAAAYDRTVDFTGAWLAKIDAVTPCPSCGGIVPERCACDRQPEGVATAQTLTDEHQDDELEPYDLPDAPERPTLHALDDEDDAERATAAWMADPAAWLLAGVFRQYAERLRSDDGTAEWLARGTHGGGGPGYTYQCDGGGITIATRYGDTQTATPEGPTRRVTWVQLRKRATADVEALF